MTGRLLTKLLPSSPLPRVFTIGRASWGGGIGVINHLRERQPIKEVSRPRVCQHALLLSFWWSTKEVPLCPVCRHNMACVGGWGLQGAITRSQMPKGGPVMIVLTPRPTTALI